MMSHILMMNKINVLLVLLDKIIFQLLIKLQLLKDIMILIIYYMEILKMYMK